MNSEPYDLNWTYRTGQTMSHPIWGAGEVTALIEPRKIDVLFADRIRRLIHSRQMRRPLPLTDSKPSFGQTLSDLFSQLLQEASLTLRSMTICSATSLFRSQTISTKRHLSCRQQPGNYRQRPRRDRAQRPTGNSCR